MVDSGASHHMISWKYLTMEERATKRDIGRTIPLKAATAVIWITEQVDIWIHELAISVTACLSLLEDSPCVLSLGKLLAETGYGFVWRGKDPYLEVGNQILHIYIERDCPLMSPLMEQDNARNPGDRRHRLL